MNLTFKEKSLWLMLIGLAGVSAFYGYTVGHLNQALQPDVAWQAMTVLTPMVGLFFSAVLLLVLFSVVGHIVMAIVDRRAEEDERDRLIALKGGQIGGFVLATGVFFALCVAVACKGNFLFTHLLLAFWVLAQMAEYITQLIIYRMEA